MNVTINTLTEGSIRSLHPGCELPEDAFQELLSSPPIDRDELFERCLGNLDFALTLLHEFVTTSQSRIEAFDTAMKEGNQVTLSAKAHCLKGVASVLAAHRLVAICSNLESTTSQSDWTQTGDLIQQLHHEMQRMIQFIPMIRALA